MHFTMMKWDSALLENHDDYNELINCHVSNQYEASEKAVKNHIKLPESHVSQPTSKIVLLVTHEHC